MPTRPNGSSSTLLHRKPAAAAVALMLLAAFTVFRPPATPGPLERDFEAYYAAGATVNSGGDPYSRAIWATERGISGVNGGRDELLPFVGPAAALPLWSLLARLPYAAALGIWTALLVAAIVTILGAAVRVARSPRDPWLYALIAGFALAAAPLIGAMALGQAALVSAAAIAAAVVAYRGRWVAGAFVTTLVAALQPNLALVLVARVRSGRDAAIAAGAGGVFVLLTLVAGGGAPGLLIYLRRLGAHGAAERFTAIQHTPAAIAYALGLPADGALILSALVSIAAVAVTIVIIVRERLDATTATLVACATLPLAIPFFHEHDFVIEVFPILVLALRSRGRARGLSSVAAVLVLVDWFGLAQRHVAQGQIVSLGLAVAAGFIGLRPTARRTRPADFAGLLTLALLAAIAVPLGRANPAPTWPDNLPAAYRAAATADASAVWGDEQRTAGLARREPMWGLLRGIPLAGCIVLAAALVTDARRRRRAILARSGRTIPIGDPHPLRHGVLETGVGM